MIRPRFALLAALAPLASVALLASGCTSSSGAGSSGAPADGGELDATPSVSCQKDPRVEPYATNLTKTSASGAMKVTLVASEPAPPTRGNNTWTVRVTDAAGSPLSGASLTVTPFMPDHGHGTSVQAIATPQADGSYTLAPLFLFMPGVWRITIELASGDAGADAGAGPAEAASFFFCVEG